MENDKLFPFMLELENLLNKYKFSIEAGPDFVEIMDEDGKNHAIMAHEGHYTNGQHVKGPVRLSYEGPGHFGKQD